MSSIVVLFSVLIIVLSLIIPIFFILNEGKKRRKEVANMKYCTECGMQLPSETNFCTECGASSLIEELQSKEVPTKKYCPSCGAELDKRAIFCMMCGKKQTQQIQQTPYITQPQQQYQSIYQPNCYPPSAPIQADNVNSPGLNVLSFFFPLIGFILYLVFINDRPIKAKGCGKWALISFLVNLFIVIISIIAVAAGAGY